LTALNEAVLFESDSEKYGEKMINLTTVDFKGEISTSGVEVELVEDVLASLDLIGWKLRVRGSVRSWWVVGAARKTGVSFHSSTP